MFKSDIWLFFWIGLVALIAAASSYKIKKQETVLGQQTERYSLFFSAIVFLPIFLFVSIGEIRADIGAYLGIFDSINMSVSDVFREWWITDKGPGFILIEVLIKQVFGNNRVAFRIIVGLIQSIPLLLIYRKYSEDYIFSIFLFIATGCYNGWMMNGLRQFVAACLIFGALPFLLNKKYIPLILVVLAAVSIHQSAMLMVPVLIIVQFKPWSKLAVIAFVVFTIVLFFYIFHSDWVSEEYLQSAKGSNPLRIAISAIPVVIAFIGRKEIAKSNNLLINICVNMSIVTTLIYFVASFTSGIMTGRLPGYTGIYNFILIPYLSKKVFNETVSKNIKLFFVIFYTAYFIFGLITGAA